MIKIQSKCWPRATDLTGGNAMYVNPYFEENDLNTIHTLIEEHRFGMLVSTKHGLRATHIPFILHRNEGSKGTLVSHAARADPIWRGFDGQTEMLAIFPGPKTYVRSRWYSEAGISTYNFIAVHVYGKPRMFEEEDQIIDHLDELLKVHECDYQDPWLLDEIPSSWVVPFLRAIAPFSMEIERVEAKVKVSQNRSAADREGVRQGLRERGYDDDIAIANLMEVYPYTSEEGRPLLEPVLDEHGILKVQEDR